MINSRWQCVHKYLKIISHDFSALHHPVFENCPLDEVIHLTLPRGAQEVFLDTPLYAHDYLGQNIPIMGSHDIPPGARWVNYFWI